MAYAKAKGRRIGRPQAKDDVPVFFHKHYQAYTLGKMNVPELARVCGLSRQMVFKYIKLL